MRLSRFDRATSESWSIRLSGALCSSRNNGASGEGRAVRRFMVGMAFCVNSKSGGRFLLRRALPLLYPHIEANRKR